MLLMVQDTQMGSFPTGLVGAGTRVIRTTIVHQQYFIRACETGEIGIPGRHHLLKVGARIEGMQDGRKRRLGDRWPFRSFGHGLIQREYYLLKIVASTNTAGFKDNCASPPRAVHAFPRDDRRCEIPLRGVLSSGAAAM